MDTLPEIRAALLQLDEIVSAIVETVGVAAVQKRLNARADQRRHADYVAQLEAAKAAVDTGVATAADTIGPHSLVFVDGNAYLHVSQLDDTSKAALVGKKVDDTVMLGGSSHTVTAIFTPVPKPTEAPKPDATAISRARKAGGKGRK